MKKICLLFLLFPAFFFAQKRFPKSDVIWFQSQGQYWYPSSSNGWTGYTSKNYYKQILYPTNTDTLIGSLTYKKIYYQPFFASTATYFACYREDTLTRKVYVIEKDSSTAKLIYDFSAHFVGDTIKNIYNPRGFSSAYPVFYTSLAVTSIDSVLIASAYHKRYNMKVTASTCPALTAYYVGPNNSPIRWIEGYGSMAGLFQQVEEIPTLSMFSYTFALECLSKGGVSIFPPSANCLVLNIDENHNALQNNIYPNPFINKITIDLVGEKQTIQIFNALGSLIYKTEIENEKIEINLEKEPNGIYFIKIGSSTRKIIKE